VYTHHELEFQDHVLRGFRKGGALSCTRSIPLGEPPVGIQISKVTVSLYLLAPFQPILLDSYSGQSMDDQLLSTQLALVPAC
jgi:hypothetical protein